MTSQWLGYTTNSKEITPKGIITYCTRSGKRWISALLCVLISSHEFGEIFMREPEEHNLEDVPLVGWTLKCGSTSTYCTVVVNYPNRHWLLVDLTTRLDKIYISENSDWWAKKSGEMILRFITLHFAWFISLTKPQLGGAPNTHLGQTDTVHCKVQYLRALHRCCATRSGNLLRSEQNGLFGYYTNLAHTNILRSWKLKPRWSTL